MEKETLWNGHNNWQIREHRIYPISIKWIYALKNPSNELAVAKNRPRKKVFFLKNLHLWAIEYIAKDIGNWENTLSVTALEPKNLMMTA